MATADLCSCFTPTAVHCVRLLQRQNVSQGALFTKMPIDSAMATALTHVLSYLHMLNNKSKSLRIWKAFSFESKRRLAQVHLLRPSCTSEMASSVLPNFTSKFVMLTSMATEIIIIVNLTVQGVKNYLSHQIHRLSLWRTLAEQHLPLDRKNRL